MIIELNLRSLGVGWALVKNPRLNKKKFIDCFVGGLREDIQLGIQELGFTTLKEAIV